MEWINEFLNSEEEQHAWHKGIYKGLKYHNPKRLYDEFTEYDSFKEWEDDEQQYEDLIMTATYTSKMFAYGIGLKYSAEITDFMHQLL